MHHAGLLDLLEKNFLVAGVHRHIDDLGVVGFQLPEDLVGRLRPERVVARVGADAVGVAGAGPRRFAGAVLVPAGPVRGLIETDARLGPVVTRLVFRRAVGRRAAVANHRVDVLAKYPRRVPGPRVRDLVDDGDPVPAIIVGDRRQGDVHDALGAAQPDEVRVLRSIADGRGRRRLREDDWLVVVRLAQEVPVGGRRHGLDARGRAGPDRGHGSYRK